MKSIVQPKQLLASALMLLCGLTAMAQTTITTYKPGLSTDGAVYYLPKTVLNVSVTVTKTTYTPGELCQYADRYLRIAGISSKSESYYTLQSATIATEAAPDENKLFHILFAPNTVAPLVTMTEDCILHAINMPVPEAEQPLAVPVAAEESQSLSPRSYMTEEMLMTGSKAKLAEIVARGVYGISSLSGASAPSPSPRPIRSYPLVRSVVSSLLVSHASSACSMAMTSPVHLYISM